MKVLALDTASPLPAVALSMEEGLFEERLPMDGRASEDLLPAIERVLAAGGVKLWECGRLAVCSGPGSFTGIRVGMATAWGLGRVLRVPVEHVPTLEALAEAGRGGNVEEVISALEAGRGEVVVQPFSIQEERARPLAAAERLARGEAALRYRGRQIVTLPEDLIGRPGRPLSGSPARAAALAVARAPRDRAAPSAIYSRASAAEEKLGAS